MLRDSLCANLAAYQSSKQTEHAYGWIYEFVFAWLRERQGDSLRVLELGVYRGESASAFASQSYVSAYVGVDTDVRQGIPDSPKIVCYQMNAYALGTVEFLHQHEAPFHLIIDDAYHDIHCQQLFLQLYPGLLDADGLLWCEDICVACATSRGLQHRWLKAGAMLFHVHHPRWVSTVCLLSKSAGLAMRCEG